MRKPIMAIGNDHTGTKLKFEIMEFLVGMRYVVNKFGTDSTESVGLS